MKNPPNVRHPGQLHHRNVNYLAKRCIFKGIMFENVETFQSKTLSWYFEICNKEPFISYKVGKEVGGLRGVMPKNWLKI